MLFLIDLCACDRIGVARWRRGSVSTVGVGRGCAVGKIYASAYLLRPLSPDGRLQGYSYLQTCAPLYRRRIYDLLWHPLPHSVSSSLLRQVSLGAAYLFFQASRSSLGASDSHCQHFHRFAAISALGVPDSCKPCGWA